MQLAWSNIESLLNEMKPLLLEGKCKAVHMSERTPDEYKTEYLADVYDWLHQLYLGEAYAEAVKAWALVPPEQWANYKVLGAHGLREQLILESALRDLQKAWKANRPGFFNHKKKHEPEEQAEQDADQANPGSKRVRSNGRRTPQADR